MTRETTAAQQADRRIDAALRRRHYLAIAVREGWIDWLGSDEMAGRHLVAVHGRQRLLTSATPTWIRGGEVRIDEPTWWTVGVADGHGVVLPDRLPDHGGLLTTAETADELGLSVEGVGYRVDVARRDPQANPLTPLGVSRKDSWRFFSLQVAAHLAAVELAGLIRYRAVLKANSEPLDGTSEAITQGRRRVTRTAKAWAAVADLFPAPAELTDDMVDVAASPDPLPLGSHHDQDNRLQAMLTGDREKWFSYDGFNSATDQFQVTFARDGGPFTRQLPREAVLPWVLGVADTRDGHQLVAYREGLG